MKYLTLYVHIFSILLFTACKTTEVQRPNFTVSNWSKMDISQQQFLDSILQKGLDNEALFTLLTNLKPISSLVSFGYPIANIDSTKKTKGNILNRETHGIHLDRIQFMQQAINQLNIPDLSFVLSPYNAAHDGRRVLQLSVVRVSALDSLLRSKETFFGQFGLVPGADPNIVLSTVENADRYERLRGYGYLFGYPDHAIDFFVDAFLESDTTKSHIERNFFRIPTFEHEEGNFVYAYPKDQVPSAHIDSIIYYKGRQILEDYSAIRSNYLNPDSTTIQSYRLIQDFYKTSLHDK